MTLDNPAEAAVLRKEVPEETPNRTGRQSGSRQLSRRQFLKLAGAATGVTLLAAACRGPEGPPAAPAAEAPDAAAAEGGEAAAIPQAISASFEMAGRQYTEAQFRENPTLLQELLPRLDAAQRLALAKLLGSADLPDTIEWYDGGESPFGDLATMEQGNVMVDMPFMPVVDQSSGKVVGFGGELRINVSVYDGGHWEVSLFKIPDRRHWSSENTVAADQAWRRTGRRFRDSGAKYEAIPARLAVGTGGLRDLLGLNPESLPSQTSGNTKHMSEIDAFVENSVGSQPGWVDMVTNAIGAKLHLVDDQLPSP